MPRTARLPHELRLRNHKGQAVCTYRGHVFPFGPWLPGTPGNPGGAPSPEALAGFQRQVGVWSQNPHAGLYVEPAAVDYLPVLWRDWLASSHAPSDGWMNEQAGRLLFGTAAEPGPHRATDVATFTPADLLAWQSALCRLTETRKGRHTGRRYGRRMVTRFASLVKRCFLWGAVVGRVHPDRAAAIKLVPGPAAGEARKPAKVSAVPEERVNATLPHLPPPVAAAVMVLRWCGARPGEVLELRSGDVVRAGVCWAGGTVPLDLDALGVWAAVKGEHKNEWRGHDRVIFFGPLAQAVLAPLLSDDPSVPLFRPEDAREFDLARKRSRRTPGGRGNREVPKGANGRPLNPTYPSTSFRQAVHRGCLRAGVPHWCPKMLRKLCLGLVQARFGPDAASAVGGHAATGVTQKHYTGLDFAAAAKAMAAMG